MNEWSIESIELANIHLRELAFAAAVCVLPSWAVSLSTVVHLRSNSGQCLATVSAQISVTVFLSSCHLWCCIADCYCWLFLHCLDVETWAV